jgi:hypothetical protein
MKGTLYGSKKSGNDALDVDGIFGTNLLTLSAPKAGVFINHVHFLFM